MLARVSLVALILASPAWADSDYPAGLFERSPVTDGPAADSRHPSPALGRTTRPSRDRARGGCHHYREWRYPYPQPC
jgi:hypothetical protein